MRRTENEPTKEDLKSIPTPTFVYQVGERVQYGAWDYAQILEVFEDGLYYKLFIRTSRYQYGQYKGEEEKDIYLAWLDFKPYKSQEEIDKLEVLQEDVDIRFSYSQRQLESLLHILYRDIGLDLDPDYQRGNVWTLAQKVALIDSIFKNIDIGKFTIIRRRWKDDIDYLYEILDGKQRTIAISEFFEGRFTYQGMRYQDLHPSDQNHFKNYAISYAEINPLTNEQKYRYFLKLNTSGQPHEEEHLNKVKEMWYNEKSNLQ